MAVDSPHDDDAVEVLRGRNRDRDDDDVIDVPDDRPVVRVDREECYTELRAFHAVEMQVGSRDWAEQTGDGRWKWKGLELDAATNRIADAALGARREAEGRDGEGNYGETGITPAMRRIEGELEHGSLVPDTERFALKSPDRFKEKLANLIERRPDESAADLAAEIHDGIRYTFTFDSTNYADGVKQACGLIERDGSELDQLANRWGGEEYKGINSRWRHIASGQFFEVQFHTHESWEVKQTTHDTYEKVNDRTTGIEEVELLRAHQRELARSLIPPERCEDIDNYRRPRS